MPPKAKPKPKARVRAKAKPKAAVRRMARRGILRRPAVVPPVVPAPGDREAWSDGGVASLIDVPLEQLGRSVKLVVVEGTYFTAPCQAAGVVDKIEIDSGQVHIHAKLSGTNNENLLKYASGKPRELVRIHRCDAHCTGDRVAEDLIHGVKARLRRSDALEEGWIDNLVTVEPIDDELKDLRVRGEGLPADRGDPAAVARERGRSSGKKDKKRKKKDKKGRRHKKGDRSSEEKKSKEKKIARAKKEVMRSGTSTSGTSTVDLSGRKPRSASIKPLKALFAGTGLDPKEKVRKKVAKRARRRARKAKDTKSGSSEENSSSASSSHDGEALDSTLFDPDTRLQKIAEFAPGALAAQALQAMRSGLLQSIGSEDRPGALAPVGLAYFRQQLVRRSTGPVQRELVNLCTALDWLVRGSPARAADVISQRLKSIESSLSGTHWSVSQRLEVCPQDTMSLAAKEELSSAQRAAADEAKVTYLAGLPDGRRSKGKGKDKDKGQPVRKEFDKGKGRPTGKGDHRKQKDDQAAK